MRIAIVGTGFGAIHAEAFRRVDDCQISAVCSRTPERARADAERWGARACTDFRELLAPGSCDAVSIATPAPMQAEIGAAALRCGLPVFFEKPLALSVDAARELVRLAAQRALATAVNFEFPELAVFRQARQLLEEGQIGPVRHVVIRWHLETYANRQHLSSWKTRAAEGGGALNLFGSHVLYYLEWLLGPMRRLCARVQRSPGDERDGDTIDTLALDAVSGVPVTASIATNAFAGAGHRVDIFGEQGTLRLDNPSPDYARGFRLDLASRGEVGFRTIMTEDTSDDSLATEDGRIAPTARIARRFVEAVRGGPPCMPDAGCGLRVQLLMHAIRQSEALGRRMDLDANQSD